MGIKEKVERYIFLWEKRDYKNGIPDEAPHELEKLLIVPSYRVICIALMKNENNLETLGYKRKKCNAYNAIKKQEIETRKLNKNDKEGK